MRLRPQAERDALLRDLVETTQYVDDDGKPYVPPDLDVSDPEGDVDAEEEAQPGA